MIHDIDLALWYLDAPIATVYARTLATSGASGPPDVLAAVLTTADGRVATLQSTWLTPGGATRNLPGAPLDPLDLEGTIEAQLDVAGTRGSARVDLDDGSRIVTDDRAVASSGLWPAVHGRIAGALREELAHFVTCAAGRRPSELVPIAQSVHAVEVADAIVRSAERGEAVAL
jgi:predicted dehydrogenase